MNGKFSRYKASAKEKNKEFSLTIDDFKELWQSKCYYCGGKVDTVRIDRINNFIGYHADNVVACCSECNYMKRTQSVEEFIKKCKKIVNNWKLNL